MCKEVAVPADYEQDLDFIEATLHELANWARDCISEADEAEHATQKIDLIQVALMKLHMVRHRLETVEPPRKSHKPQSN